MWAENIAGSLSYCSMNLPTLQYATFPFVCQAWAFLLAQIGDVIFINTFFVCSDCVYIPALCTLCGCSTCLTFASRTENAVEEWYHCAVSLICSLSPGFGAHFAPLHLKLSHHYSIFTYYSLSALPFFPPILLLSLNHSYFCLLFSYRIFNSLTLLQLSCLSAILVGGVATTVILYITFSFSLPLSCLCT